MYYLQSGFKYCTRIHLYFFPLYIGFYKTFNLVIARYKMWLILNILQIYCVLECMHDIMNAVILIVTMNGNKSYMYLRLIKVLIFYLQPCARSGRFLSANVFPPILHNIRYMWCFPGVGVQSRYLVKINCYIFQWIDTYA